MTEKAEQLGKEYAFGFHECVDGFSCNHGINKREYFAGLAMQGILSNSSVKIEVEPIIHTSLLFANSLLEELSKTE